MEAILSKNRPLYSAKKTKTPVKKKIISLLKKCLKHNKCTGIPSPHMTGIVRPLITLLHFAKLSSTWHGLRFHLTAINKQTVCDGSAKILVKTNTHFPLLTSHTMTVWSNEPVMSWVPVELKDNEMISAEWPCNSMKNKIYIHSS